MSSQFEGKNTINVQEAALCARQALHSITREYPNAPGQVLNSPADIQSPKALHPAFYGCFDWHSAVHSHWTLARLLRLFPDLPEGATIRAALNTTLTAANLQTEADYFDQPNHQAFERMYGWAWVLQLDAELMGWNDPDGLNWHRDLQPLTRIITGLIKNFLPKQTYPIRVGTHPNTAFNLTLCLEYARKAGNRELETLLVERSLDYFKADKNYPAGWEPGGSDFLSPALTEADLMSQILPEDEFSRWFEEFLPGVAGGEPKGLLYPAIVSDHSDPALGHLNGLQLSRAWAMRRIAHTLPQNAPARPILLEAAGRHSQAGLPQAITSDYMGGHWLASFAVYLQTLDLP
jgi:hypothetical protein